MENLPDDSTIKAWVQLHRAHRKLLDEVGAVLKNHKMPPLDWYDVMLELHRERDSGLRQYAIGERILLSKHNLSRLIDRLEKQQLVRREACEEDGRGNRISLTQQGEELLKQIWPVYGEAIQREFGDRLHKTELAELARLLDKFFE